MSVVRQTRTPWASVLTIFGLEATGLVLVAASIFVCITALPASTWEPLVEAAPFFAAGLLFFAMAKGLELLQLIANSLVLTPQKPAGEE